MLNIFPNLLVLGFFAPMIIRAAVAAYSLHVAYVQYKRRDEISKMRFPLVGAGMWIASVSIAFHAVVGLMLLFGYATQIAALLALVALIKGMFLIRWYPRFVPHPRSAMLLLIVMCLSLLLSGAGAFAQDLPL